ncbi:MAG: universal stress protein [Alicyclobacillaceae bacterium]|nr:universal stress protein [Alicyclobacillaceae bacterium]MCY0896408.1 universal stress protein [Alicyclobacillaceae bacterium]
MKEWIDVKKVLFASDGSASSKKAQEAVVSILSAWPEVEVTVLHVITESAMVMSSNIQPQLLWDAETAVVQEVKEAVKPLLDDFPNRVTFRTERAIGSPAHKICEVGEQTHADLLVVGSHGRGTVDGLLLGSVSHGVMHRAKMSVLVVK